jgi:predicted permease
MVLLTGAGLLARTLVKLQSVDTGVNADHALTLQLPIELALEDFARQQGVHRASMLRIRESVAALPGLEVVSLASTPPLRGTMLDFDVKAEGRPLAPDEAMPHAALKSIDERYFKAAGITLIDGRSFDTTDDASAAKVVVINRSFARRLFGDRDPIGQRVAWTGEVLKFTPVSGEWRTVVGVAADTRDEGLDTEPTATIYQPFAQSPVVAGALIVRTAGDPSSLRPAILRAIRAAEPRQLVERVATLEEIRDETVAPRRLNALFITSFAVLAMVIAMVGIAGVLAFSVSTRIAEIGIRMSLGADARRVQRMVLGQGGVLLLAGLGVGLGGALLATRVLSGLLFGVGPNDPLTLGGVALILGAVGAAACWLPAMRAARVDPAVALRAE